MTEQREKQTAKQAYVAAKTDIADLHWGHAGSLQKVKADLLEALAFKSGHDLDSLKEALEEARLC